MPPPLLLLEGFRCIGLTGGNDQSSVALSLSALGRSVAPERRPRQAGCSTSLASRTSGRGTGKRNEQGRGARVVGWRRRSSSSNNLTDLGRVPGIASSSERIRSAPPLWPRTKPRRRPAGPIFALYHGPMSWPSIACGSSRGTSLAFVVLAGLLLSLCRWRSLNFFNPSALLDGGSSE